MLAALLTGLGIGLAAGVSPGPLLVLVITATLRDGLRHGLAVAAAPLLSDLLVVGVVLLTLGRLPLAWVGRLGVVGGLLVVVVGLQTIRESRTATLSARADGPATPTRDALLRGTLVNLLSPHPWISWITVLGPLTLNAWRQAPGAGVALVAGFYVTLVGSKAALAYAVARGRHRLSDAAYRRTVLVAGVVLIGLGVLMAYEFAAHPPA